MNVGFYSKIDKRISATEISKNLVICNYFPLFTKYFEHWLCSDIEQLNNFSESDIFMFSTLIFLI